MTTTGRRSWTAIRGFRRFFPLSFLYKTRLGVLAVLAIAVWMVFRRGGSGPTNREEGSSGYDGSFLYRTAPLWVWIGVYGAAAVFSHLNVGHRHLAPIYPALFILAGAANGWLTDPSRRRDVSASPENTDAIASPPNTDAIAPYEEADAIPRPKRFDRGILVAVCLAVAVLEGLAAFPHYLAYFNPLAGGSSRGYRRLVDSSLDWGLDLPSLKSWIDAERVRHPDTSSPIYLSYFGTGVPSYYGIDYKGLPSYLDIWEGRELFPLTAGTYCISATMLQNLYVKHIGLWNVTFEAKYQDVIREMSLQGRSASTDGQGNEPIDWGAKTYEFDELRFVRLCSWLRQREPDDQVGYSILIYRLSQEEVRQAVAGPPAELLPEPAAGLDYGSETQETP
jgi:hypothetical protein